MVGRLHLTNSCRLRSLRFHEKGLWVKGDGGALGAARPPDDGPTEERDGPSPQRPCTSLPFALLVAELCGRCMLRFESVGCCKLTFELARRRLSAAIAVTRTRCGSWNVTGIVRFTACVESGGVRRGLVRA